RNKPNVRGGKFPNLPIQIFGLRWLDTAFFLSSEPASTKERKRRRAAAVQRCESASWKLAATKEAIAASRPAIASAAHTALPVPAFPAAGADRRLNRPPRAAGR